MSATPNLKINVINKFIQSQPVAGGREPSIMGAIAGVGGAGAASQSPVKEAAVEQNSSIKEIVGKYNKCHTK